MKIYQHHESWHTGKEEKAVHVMFHPSGSKTASQPNTLGPLAGTIVPSVRPSKIKGSVPEFKCIFEREIRAEMG